MKNETTNYLDKLISAYRNLRRKKRKIMLSKGIAIYWPKYPN